MCGLLIVVASLVAERRLSGTRASVGAARGVSRYTPGLQSTGSIIVVQGLSCSEACGIFPDQELNLLSSALAGRFLYH